MPAHRTVQTALLVKTNDVIARDWEELHRDTPPGGLRLALPTKNGGSVDLAGTRRMGSRGLPRTASSAASQTSSPRSSPAP